MSVGAQVILGGEVAQSATADNATATVTVAATPGMRHFMTGVWADFSAAPSATYKTITIKKAGVTVIVKQWDFSTGSAFIPFPTPIRGDVNAAVSAELSASGTGAVLGRIALYYFSV